MSRFTRTIRGNTTALVVATLGIFFLIVGYFFLNYNQLLGARKEGQTAIEAAALAAAKDMGSIVVTCSLGQIGLIDNYQSGASSYPVQGVNTILGTLRLDALIASQIQNSTITYLVNQDIQTANAAIQQLVTSINSSASGGSSAVDVNGNSVNIATDAQSAYNANPERLAMQQQAGSPLSVSVGTLSGQAVTNIPTPVQPGAGSAISDNTLPISAVVTSKGTQYYLANVSIPMPGSAQSVVFGATGSSTALVDNNLFSTVGSTNNIPTVVQVSTTVQVKSVAKNNNASTISTMKVLATAQAGGAIMPFASGTLSMAFPQGFPTNPTNNSLSFNSVVGVINAYQLDGNSGNPANGSTSPWQGSGQWLQSNGNIFSASGMSGLSAANAQYRGQTAPSNADPSVALAYGVYDWLRTLGLRPKADSVVNALQTNFQQQFSGSSSDYIISQNSERSINLIAPAYADSNSGTKVTTALLSTDDGHGDPRDLSRWQQNPTGYARQVSRTWGYIPADDVLPNTASTVQLTADGQLTSTDGNPVSDVVDFENAIVSMDKYAIDTYNSAFKILSALKKHVNDIPSDHKKYMLTRACRALQNSSYCLTVVGAMRQNQRALTGGGVQEISSRHFVVMGSDFYPPTQGATVENIIKGGKISTGQDPAVLDADWCNKLNSNHSSKLNFYKHTAAPVIGRNRDNSFLQAAQAQQALSTIPTNNLLQFLFHLDTNTAPGTASVVIHPTATSPFASESTGDQQLEYQDTTALTVPSPTSPTVNVSWQVRERDMAANAFPAASNSSSGSNSSTPAQYFATSGLTNNVSPTSWCSSSQQSCPALATEWQITCPVGQSTVQPPVAPTPPIGYVPPNKSCGVVLQFMFGERSYMLVPSFAQTFGVSQYYLETIPVNDINAYIYDVSGAEAAKYIQYALNEAPMGDEMGLGLITVDPATLANGGVADGGGGGLTYNPYGGTNSPFMTDLTNAYKMAITTGCEVEIILTHG